VSHQKIVVETRAEFLTTLSVSSSRRNAILTRSRTHSVLPENAQSAT